MTGGETIVTTVDHTLMRGLEPHDPGFVAGLPRSMVERGNGVPLIEISRVPLAAVPPPGMGAGGMPICWARLLIAGFSHVRSDGRSRPDVAGDGPGEAQHLAGDGGGHHVGRLAGRVEPSVAGAQPELGLPGDVAHRLRQ